MSSSLSIPPSYPSCCILAIESSCDDTSVAIVNEKGQVLAMNSSHQYDAHAPFGGIVPEIASRNHLYHLLPLLQKTLQDGNIKGDKWSQIHALAVTSRPGLVGSLLVGVLTAKSIAMAKKLPLMGINHLEGHLLSPLLSSSTSPLPHPQAAKASQVSPTPQTSSLSLPPQPCLHSRLRFPLVGMVVSGGHSSLYALKDFGKYKLLGHSLDDAAGEAFDKFAKKIGLGFPGGVQVDRWAQKNGDPHRFSFPRAFLQAKGSKASIKAKTEIKAEIKTKIKTETKADSNTDSKTITITHTQDQVEDPNLYNMSFSGLKTAAHHLLEKMSEKEREKQMPHLCASFQESICDVLIYKLNKAVEKLSCEQCLLTGGVSANSRLRQRAKAWAQQKGIELLLPQKTYCTDNAAMIALAGVFQWQRKRFDSIEALIASPFSLEKDFFLKGIL